VSGGEGVGDAALVIVGHFWRDRPGAAMDQKSGGSGWHRFKGTPAENDWGWVPSAAQGTKTLPCAARGLPSAGVFLGMLNPGG
jgi:hypothetical protein